MQIKPALTDQRQRHSAVSLFKVKTCVPVFSASNTVFLLGRVGDFELLYCGS